MGCGHPAAQLLQLLQLLRVAAAACSISGVCMGCGHRAPCCAV